MDVVSFFSGAGGLDKGFSNAGFKVIWANEFDKTIWETFKLNHPETLLDTRSITEINENEVPRATGIIGGPPCQSWSAAGALRGIRDKRGQLFLDFIRILSDRQPLFFLAENVAGMLLPRNKPALQNIIEMFEISGYNVTFNPVNAADYGVPQDRKRVFFVGYRKDLKIKFSMPEPTTPSKFDKMTLRAAIGDLKDSARPAIKGNHPNGEFCAVPNHEYMTGSYSPIFMSRNRVRSWEEVSFTIQAGARHAPLHPQSPKMKYIEQDRFGFVRGGNYRRLSVRECARIQTFPDDFIFIYERVSDGYKMIGNAVPVKLAEIIASRIRTDLMQALKQMPVVSKKRSKSGALSELIERRLKELLAS